MRRGESPRTTVEVERPGFDAVAPRAREPRLRVGLQPSVHVRRKVPAIRAEREDAVGQRDEPRLIEDPRGRRCRDLLVCRAGIQIELSADSASIVGSTSAGVCGDHVRDASSSLNTAAGGSSARRSRGQPTLGQLEGVEPAGVEERVDARLRRHRGRRARDLEAGDDVPREDARRLRGLADCQHE